MFFLQDDEQTYPRCALYMKHDLAPRTFKQSRKKIYDAFVSACGTEAGAIEALTWGNDPKVGIAAGTIKIGGNTMCGINPPAFFNQNNGAVLISNDRATPLEACITSLDIINNKRRFESTLLHETVHFVRMVYNIIDPDYNLPNSSESGEQFEIWAYGELQCTKDEIADAKSSVF